MTITRDDLIRVQMEEWPDSRILTLHDVLVEWVDGDPKWPPKISPLLDRDYQLRMAELAVTRHRLSNARQVIRCLRHDPVVFYECGKHDDGSYGLRGCRYGVKEYEYFGGFER
jgi:hypothetical protein